MLLELKENWPERNTSRLRHINASVQLEDGEQVPDWAVCTDISCSWIGSLFNGMLVTEASSVTDGQGLLVVEVGTLMWMSLNYRGSTLSQGFLSLRDGKRSDENPNTFVFVVE